MRLLLIVMIWLVSNQAFGFEKPVPIDTVVVCPPAFQKAIQPWVEYRSAQGHKIQLILPEKTAKATKSSIQRIAKTSPVKHVVLVGDAVFDRGQIRRPGYLTPTFLEAARVNVKFGSEKTISTDTPYSDLDNDKVPDIAVGRISVDTPEQLSKVIKKIVRYENKDNVGEWLRRINFIAGVGGFGKLEDSALETATKSFISNRIPHGYQTSMTYGSWRSPYCPDPRRFHDITVKRFNEGCLFWVYIGHGHPLQLDKVNLSGIGYHILDINDMSRLKAKGSPIAIFLACYTCAFDMTRDCIAEEMIRLEDGPIAVIGGTRVTIPYSMGVLSHEMINDYFYRDTLTLGEVVMNAKKRSLDDVSAEKDQTRQVLKAVASLISPTRTVLKEEREECVLLINLIGDPLTRVKRPDPVVLETAKTVKAGDSIEVSGTVRGTGEMVVEVVYPRKRDTVKTPNREEIIWTNDEFLSYQQVYESANKRDVSRRTISVTKPGPFKVKVPIPAGLRGKFNVRAYLKSPTRFALGSTEIKIR